MKTVATPATGHPLRRFWYRWRFHLNILLILIPLGFMPRYFQDVALFRGESGLGQREAGTIDVGPWQLTLAEMRTLPPAEAGQAGFFKQFNAALCEGCSEEVKATYLRIGKPRSLRAAGALFFGSPYRMSTNLPVPTNTKDDALVWVTMEGWDGTVHQGSISLADASPSTLAWLQNQGDAQ
jgi:hypothetical protein